MSLTTLLFNNLATSTLGTAITNSATLATLASGTGALFPSPGANQAFHLTFTDATTQTLNEIVSVTTLTGDTITMVRAQEGTSALAWNVGDFARQLITAGDMRACLQLADTPGILVGPPQTFTTSTTADISFPSGTNRFLCEMVGGGGSGGEAQPTTGGQASVGSGGNSGGVIRAWVSTGLSAVQLEIGAAGSSGTSGASSILITASGTVAVAQGGLYGGSQMAGSSFPQLAGPQASGTLSTGGNVAQTYGDLGKWGFMLATNDVNGGDGASSPYGTGGKGEVISPAGTFAAGLGLGFGAGGGGAVNTTSGSPVFGAAGSPGYAVIWPYS